MKRNDFRFRSITSGDQFDAHVHRRRGGADDGAAAAWNNLAAELNTTASASQSVISTLTDDEWRGPSAAAMAGAAAPYVAWMHTTATAAQHAANQAWRPRPPMRPRLP